MANVDPQTIEDIQDAINTLVANDSDTPEEGDEEWTTRLNLIWTVIRTWGTTKDVFFAELWKTYSSSPTTISAATTYSLSGVTDYRFPGNKLRVTLNGEIKRINIVKTKDVEKYEEAGAQVAYITGNQKDGFVLNLTQVPTAGDGIYGGTFAFDYYKFPYKPTANSDKVEMSDPNFIVWKVAGIKSLLEGQRNKFSVYDDEAADCMDNMVIMNDLTPDQGGDNVENTDALNGAVLGE